MCNGRVVVLDNVLTQDTLESLFATIERMTFSAVDYRTARIWNRTERLNPSIGDRMVWHQGLQRDGPQLSSAARITACRLTDLFSRIGYRLYPTGSPFDRLLEVSVDTARRHVVLTNGPSSDPFTGVVATVYRYGAGARLRWHTDKIYLGAFVAYVSPTWDENSGGYLAIQNGEQQRASGIGQIIEPRCNRIVIMAPDVRHSVLSIADDAGRPRVSVSGFFLTRSAVSAMVTKGLCKSVRDT